MSIQNNINAMLGTVAGAATMGKHVAEQAKANDLADKNAAIKAVDNIEKTIEDYNELNYDAGLKSTELEAAQKEFEELKQKGPTLEATIKNSEINKLKEAQQSLQMKVDAKKLQAEIYRDQINKVGKNGKDLGIVKLPWEKEIK